MTLQDADVSLELDRWRRSMIRGGLASGTITVRLRVLRSWLAFTGGRWMTATFHDVEAWVDEHSSGWCPTTTRSAVGHVRAFYRWTRREELTVHDPTALVDLPRLPQPLPRPASDEDWRRALLLLGDPWRTAVLVAGGAGLRCCELAPLLWADVDLEHRRLVVVNGKGGKGRVAGIIPQVVAELAALNGTRGLVLGRRMLASRVSQGGSMALRAIGVRATMHQFRHRYATELLGAGANLVEVQHALGHATLGMTQRYAAVRPEDVVAAAERVPWV